MKLFKDVCTGDKIFILDPRPKEASKIALPVRDILTDPTKFLKHTIHECTVIKSGLHPKSKNQKVWVLEFYTPFRQGDKMEERLQYATSVGVANTVQTLLVEKDQSMVLLMIQPLPTVLATTRMEIERWIQRN